MRHLKRTAKLGRTGEHRNAMLANLVCSLIKHKRVTTTLAKAKAARSVAEKMVTLVRGELGHPNRAPHLEALADRAGRSGATAEHLQFFNDLLLGGKLPKSKLDALVMSAGGSLPDAVALLLATPEAQLA